MSALLTKCGACANEVSVSASACPKCGHPNHHAAPKSNPQGFTMNFKYGLGGGIVLAFLGLVLIGKISGHSDRASRAPSSYEAPSQAYNSHEAAPSQGYQSDETDSSQDRPNRETAPAQRPAQARQRSGSGTKVAGLQQSFESKFGPKPAQTGANHAVREVSEYLRQEDPELRLSSCMQVRADQTAGWIVGCTQKDGQGETYANWFVIRGEKVVKRLPRSAFQMD